MKIIVAIKQAPARDSLLRIHSAASWIQEDDLSFEINEPDAYALEAGLQLKEKNGGGPWPRAQIVQSISKRRTCGR